MSDADNECVNLQIERHARTSHPGNKGSQGAEAGKRQIAAFKCLISVALRHSYGQKLQASNGRLGSF